MRLIGSLFRGEDSEEADAGAYLLADALEALVVLRGAFTKSE